LIILVEIRQCQNKPAGDDADKNAKSERMAEKSIIFISDAHLSPASIEREKLLADFLEKTGERLSHLYILGDLFDFWFEYRNAIPAFYLAILSSLRRLAAKDVSITYLPGNHDFWMKDYLTRQIGIRIAPDSLDVAHQGRKIHMFHGDGIAREDRGYRLMKRIFRFKPNIWLYSLLPVDFAYGIAHRCSELSRKHAEGLKYTHNDYYDYALEKIKGGADAVIMGHTHIPEIKELAGGLYINSGDWVGNLSYVVLENGSFRLDYLKL